MDGMAKVEAELQVRSLWWMYWYCNTWVPYCWSNDYLMLVRSEDIEEGSMRRGMSNKVNFCVGRRKFMITETRGRSESTGNKRK